jgi:gliding motility-associated-like protein
MMNFSTLTRTLLLGLSICVAFTQKSQASHSVGADISYTCLGGSNYEVTLAFYRDCSGVSAPNSPWVRIKAPSCGYTGSSEIILQLTLEPGFPIDVAPVCASVTTTCQTPGSPYPGIEKYVYKAQVTLPAACTDWSFYYSTCCRNPAITNINNPGSQSMYVEATLNSVAAPCNSSSSFTNDPVPFVCTQNQFCFNHGAIDPNSDSLSYTLIDPKTGQATTITYSAPWSVTNPITSVPGTSFNLDPINGNLCMTAAQQEVTVLAVLVEEWRGGIVVGSTIRDIQLYTINCNNDPPEPGDVNGGPSSSGDFQDTICAGFPVSFTINGFDPDGTDLLTMTWNSGIPGGTWTITGQGTSNPVGTFTWTPTAADISNTPHIFTVYIEDDACPYKGTFTRGYSVFVTGLSVDAGLDEDPAGCGLTYARTATVSGGVAPYTFLWDDGTNTAANNNLPCGTHYVTVTDASGCQGVDSVKIVCPDIVITPTIYHESCDDSCDAAVNLTVNGGVTPYTYNWANFVGNVDSAFNLCAGSQLVTVTDAGGCTDSVDAKILDGDIIPSPLFLVTADSMCVTDADTILFASYPGGTWLPGTGIDLSVNPPVFSPSVAGAGVHTVTYQLSLPNGLCMVEITEQIYVFGVDVAEITTDVLCNGDSTGIVTYADQLGNVTSYHFTNGIDTIIQNNNIYDSLPQGNYTLIGVDISSTYCPTSVPSVINAPTPVTNSLAVVDMSCYNLCDGNIISTPGGGVGAYTYNWSTGSLSANLTNLCDGTYYLTVTDGNGCEYLDTADVTKPLGFTFSETVTNANCGNSDGSAAITGVSGASGTYTYAWNTGPTSSLLTGVDSGFYTVTISDINNCDTIHTVFIDDNPGPSASVSSIITSCFDTCDGSATVTGTGGTTPGVYTYAWSDGQVVGTAVDLCAGNYSVTVSDGNNCTFITSIAVSQPTEVIADVNPFPDTTICIGGTATFNASASGGSGAGYTFAWDNGWVGSGPHNANPVGLTCYNVVATDGNNCPSAPIAACVDFYDPLVVTAFDDETICEGANVTLSAIALGGNPNNVITYSWDNGNGFGGSYTTEPQGSNPMNVIIEVVASDGCSPNDTGFVTIDFYQNPVPDFFPKDSSICPGETLDFLNTTPLGTYVACYWDYGDGNFSSQCAGESSYLYGTPGEYNVSLSVFSQEGCVGTVIGQVIVDPNPVADFTTSSPGTIRDMNIRFNDNSIGSVVAWEWELYDNENFSQMLDSLTGTSGFDYDYSIHSNAEDYVLNDTGYYPVNLSVVSADGCTHDTLKYIRIDGLSFLTIPNAFTPNGDGRNDDFFPVGIGIDPEDDYEFLIFNRWGDLIFRSNSLYDPWDGSSNELTENVDQVQQGVYIWTLQYRTIFGDLQTDLGHVSLIR